jgi:hypothetical protein
MHERVAEAIGFDDRSRRLVYLVSSYRPLLGRSPLNGPDGGIACIPHRLPYPGDLIGHASPGKTHPGLVGKHRVPGSAGPEIQ